MHRCFILQKRYQAFCATKRPHISIHQASPICSKVLHAFYPNNGLCFYYWRRWCSPSYVKQLFWPVDLYCCTSGATRCMQSSMLCCQLRFTSHVVRAVFCIITMLWWIFPVSVALLQCGTVSSLWQVVVLRLSLLFAASWLLVARSALAFDVETTEIMHSTCPHKLNQTHATAVCTDLTSCWSSFGFSMI